MSLNFGETENVSTNTTQTASTAQATQNQNNVAMNPFRIHGRTFFGDLNRSKVVSEVTETMKEIIAATQQDFNLEIIGIEQGTTNTPMSAIAIAMPWTSKTLGKDIYLAYTIYVEETLKYPTGLTQVDSNNTNQQKLTTTEDYIDTTIVIPTIKASIATSVKRKGLEVIYVGHDILPRNLSAQGLSENKSWFAEKLAVAGETFAQFIEYFIGDFAREHSQISDFKNSGSVVLHTDTSGHQQFDEVRNPIRCDIVQQLSLRRTIEKQGIGGEIVRSNEDIPMVTTTSYVDFIPFNNESTNFYQRSSKMFAPTLVITSIRTQYGVLDIDAIVNSLVASTSMYDQHAWMEMVMRQNMNSSAARMRDVGVLARDVAIELNVPNPTKVDTMSAEYTPQRHAHLLNTACLDDLAFAIELPRTSNLGLFRDIIRRSIDTSSLEYKALIKAIHHYTNGHFNINYNKPIFDISKRPVIYGSYQSSTGVHDLRDFQDYLTFSTQVGESDYGTVKEFAMKMFGENLSLDERTTWLYNRLNAMLGNINVTTKGDRYDINPEFMADLRAACNEAGLRISERVSGFANLGANGLHTQPNAFSGNKFNGGAGVFNRYSHNGGGTFGNSNYGGVGIRLGL